VGPPVSAQNDEVHKAGYLAEGGRGGRFDWQCYSFDSIIAQAQEVVLGEVETKNLDHGFLKLVRDDDGLHLYSAECQSQSGTVKGRGD